MNQATTQTDLEKALNKTDLGHFVNENKKAVLVIGALVIVAIAIYSIMNSKKHAKIDEHATVVFNFTEDYASKYLDGTLSKEDFSKNLKAVDQSFYKSEAALPIIFKLATKLQADKDLGAAGALLEESYKSLKTSTFSYYLLSLNYGAVLENANKLDEAISVYTKAMSMKYDTLKDKIYFDLGRLYLAKGDQKKSDEMFNYVVNNFKESEFNKIAKLYLDGLMK